MSENFTKMLEFMSLVGHLKHVRRTGWVQKKVGVGGGPESVADHMYRMAVLSFLVDPGAGLDKHRCMKIALVHDMAECIVGDITPQDGISKEDKHKKEKTAMKHICSLVEESVGQEIYSLWQEYEDQSSKEAEFIKDIDRFEMILQAFEYEQMDMKPRYLQDFFDSTKGFLEVLMSIQTLTPPQVPMTSQTPPTSVMPALDQAHPMQSAPALAPSSLCTTAAPHSWADNSNFVVESCMGCNKHQIWYGDSQGYT